MQYIIQVITLGGISLLLKQKMNNFCPEQYMQRRHEVSEFKVSAINLLKTLILKYS